MKRQGTGEPILWGGIISNEMIEFWIDDLVYETENAYLVEIDDEKIWLPKSQCTLDVDYVLVPEWLAIEKGLE